MFRYIPSEDVQTTRSKLEIKFEENNSSKYANGSVCRVFSESEHTWYMAIIIGAKSDALVRVRYGNKAKWIETDRKELFEFQGEKEVEEHSTVPNLFGENLFVSPNDVIFEDRFSKKLPNLPGNRPEGHQFLLVIKQHISRALPQILCHCCQKPDLASRCSKCTKVRNFPKNDQNG